MNTTRFACLGALVLLTACGGSTNPLDSTSSGTDPEGGASGGTQTSFNEGATLYTLQRVSLSGGRLIVEGLPFDGDDSYANSGITLGPDGSKPQARVFKADPLAIDDSYAGDSDGPINQDSYIAVYNETASGNARTTVARSGAYLEHGFGGYVVGRDNATTLPTTGQANYYGNYAGLRTFNGAGGIELVDGDMEMDVDFEALGDNGAIAHRVYNRSHYDENGAYLGDLPDLIGTVTAGAIQDDGQFETTTRTEYYGPNADSLSGVTTSYGTVKGMFVGSSAESVVGVIDITTESEHTFNSTTDLDGVTVDVYGFGDETTITETRETGTFVLER